MTSAFSSFHCASHRVFFGAAVGSSVAVTARRIRHPFRDLFTETTGWWDCG